MELINKHSFSKYLLAYTVPIVIYISLVGEGLITFFALIILFGCVPLLELLIKGNKQNMDAVAEAAAVKDPLYDLILYSLVPIQYGLWYLFLVEVQSSELLWWERMGKIIAFGLSCGILGINAAHELGHRQTSHEQWMSKLLLASTLYLHFFIEHNKGHHLRVATPDDPASAQKGVNIYQFYFRSIKDSWLSAWKIQQDELIKAQKGFWSLDNQMLWFQIIQCLVCLGIALFFGFWVFLWFLLAAIIGIHLLETVNYIEHYGLQRKRTASGYYERTMPVHSWNSNHPFGRILLLELTRHSDHHYQANRKYQVLRHFDESPQMPTGYPGMMLLSLVPPLWFRVMHRTIDRYKLRYEAGSDLA